MSMIKRLITLAFICVGLLVHTVLSQKLDIKNLCLFIGDHFIPEVFEGEDPVAANKAINTIFSLSKNNLLNQEYAISPEVYDKIMGTILQVSNFNPSDVYQKVKNLKPLPYDTDLKVFGDQTNSVVFYCGFTGHGMLCEIFKVNSPHLEHEYLWKVLIYNSGDELEHHPQCHVGPKKRYSPVVIYEGPIRLINQNWVEAALDFGDYQKVITNFYPRLLSDFDRSNAKYDVFIYRQRTGTCAFSSYHAYFIFKLGESEYKKIFAVASLSALKLFVFQKDSDFVSEKYRTKYSLSLPSQPNHSIEDKNGAENFMYEKLTSNPDILNEMGKFHFLRWNVDLVDTMFKYLVEIGNVVFGTKKDVFFRDLKVAYDQFQIASKKNLFNVVLKQIADNRGIKAFFSEPNWEPLELEYHKKLSAKETFYCQLPHFEHEDDAGKFTEFSNSILDFLNKEIAYKQSFMGEEIPLISYLDSLTFRVTPMLEKFTSSDVDKMGFLYTFSRKILCLLEYHNYDPFIYQKALILVQIFQTYKQIYTRYLKCLLDNNENNFKFINDLLFQKLSPSFLYSDEIDLPGRTLPRDKKLIQFLPDDDEITFELVSLLFKDNSYPPSPDEIGKFFNLDLINYPQVTGYDPNHFKRIAYILTVISRPLDLEKLNQDVLPETYLLDRHYYNLLYMLCKVSGITFGRPVLSPTASLNFNLFIHTKEDFSLRSIYSNYKETSSLLLKENRPLMLMNLWQKFSSVFYFLTYLQEDPTFIISEAGMQILYVFILKPSTYTGDSIKALPLIIRYIFFRKDKILGEVSKHKNSIQRLKLLANYQIILNRLISIQKNGLLQIGDLESAFFGEFQPIFAFLKLNTLILGEKLSELQNSHDIYLSVISNFKLIKSFFIKEEIQYVLKIYYDNLKLPSPISRFETHAEKSIQNLVNRNFLIDGEKIQLSALPFPSHRLWKIMNIKDKHDHNLKVTVHQHRHDQSIFLIFKYNDMHFFLNENDAFLLKYDKVEAKFVSEYFKLFHPILNLKISFDSRMVGSDVPIIAFKTYATNQNKKVYLFDSEGFEYGYIFNGNTLVLKNRAKFIGELSSWDSLLFDINSFCSFSSKDQSLLDTFLTRGVLFNFAMDSHIFTLENEAQSFYFFDSYNGPAKEFYAMKYGTDRYFLVIKGEKFKIHSPADIKENFFASSNLPFLFVSIKKSSQIIIPVPVSKPGDSYRFTFLKTACKDDYFNIEGHDREVDLAIVYWLVFLRYYDKAVEYVSLYTSIFLELTEIELVILQNILEIEYRDLEYVVIEVWANNLVDENDILFKGFLNEDDRAQKITNIANLIHVIPFKYKRLLLSFFPNIDEDKYLSAYSSSFKINFFLGKSKDLQPNIEILENDIKNAEFMLLYDTPSKLELTHWSNFKLLGFPSGISFLYDLAGSSERLDDFVDKFNSHYLDFIRFYLEMDENSDEYQFVCLFHIIFVVFNTLDDQNLATFFSDLKKKRFPEEVLNIYEKKMGFVSPPSYDESKRIAKPLELSPIGYDSLLIIAMQRKTLSSDLFTSDAHFMLFSDAAFFQEKLKSIVSIDELFSGFPLKALKDPKLLAQILLCGSIKELWTFFIVNDEKIPELLDLLWSHFITTFYCESPLLKKTPFCVAQAEKKEAFTQKKKIFA